MREGKRIRKIYQNKADESEKNASASNNKSNNNKQETLFIENSSAAQNSAILPHAVELNNQGIRLTLKKDYQNALELFKQADTLAPRNEQILFNIGTTLFNLKRDDEAVEVFAKIIEIAPENAIV